MITDETMEAAAKALTDEGGAPGSSLHSWRCEHPDRYGECDCVKETARVILEAVGPLIRQQARQETAEAIADAIVRHDGWSNLDPRWEGIYEAEEIAREYGRLDVSSGGDHGARETPGPDS